MSRSGLGELLLYKHSFSNDSETSLRHMRGEIRSKEVLQWLALCFNFEFTLAFLFVDGAVHKHQPVYLAFNRPSSTPHAISLTALVISYLDV